MTETVDGSRSRAGQLSLQLVTNRGVEGEKTNSQVLWDELRYLLKRRRLTGSSRGSNQSVAFSYPDEVKDGMLLPAGIEFCFCHTHLPENAKESFLSIQIGTIEMTP